MSTAENIIIGAGPSGLGCAHALAQNQRTSLTLEQNSMAGGLCQTVDFDGYRFDIGGHRYLSRSSKVNELWRSILGNDLIDVNRISRIYFGGKYYSYPLSLGNAFLNLGFYNSARCMASYIRSRYGNARDQNTLEGWLNRRFGRQLFETFFKTYSEKVWGLPCSELSADWAAQRIQGLSLRLAIQKAFVRAGDDGAKTLTREFLYPKLGAGMFYEQLADAIRSMGGSFAFDKRITKIRHSSDKITALELLDLSSNKREELAVNYMFSSLPLTALISMMDPEPPADILACAKELLFRSIIVVNLIVDKEHIFPDQWLYVHSPDIKACRIQNFKNWSQEMVADSRKTSLGVEYFCADGDEFWQQSDADLVRIASEDIVRMKLAAQSEVIRGFVIRRSYAYPVYTLQYKPALERVREYLSHFSNFQSMGRAGLFRYDNSDRALLTGIYAAKNLIHSAKQDLRILPEDELEAPL